jgi:hypothetical protein
MQNAGDQVGERADAEPLQGVEPRPGRRRARSASPPPSSQPLPSRPRRSCRGAAPPATIQQPPPAPAQLAQQADATQAQEDDSPPPAAAPPAPLPTLPSSTVLADHHEYMLSLITSSKYWELQESVLAAWNKVCSALFHPFPDEEEGADPTYTESISRQRILWSSPAQCLTRHRSTSRHTTASLWVWMDGATIGRQVFSVRRGPPSTSRDCAASMRFSDGQTTLPVTCRSV